MRLLPLTVALVAVAATLTAGPVQATENRPPPAPSVEPTPLTSALERAEIVSLQRSPVSFPTTQVTPVTVRITEDSTQRQAQVLPRNGSVTVWVRAFKEASVTAVFDDGREVTVPVTVSAPFPAVKFPKKAPQPDVVQSDRPAVGDGANPKVRKLTKKRKKQMKGVSWNPGCMPLSQLRQVFVNYIDPDGFRRRGEIIVRDSVAYDVAEMFTKFYNKGERFRSIHPVDVYGKSPKGIGANDYASMAAGNTSGFNCRYVVGKESQELMSPHAYGRSIDINTWDNPYVARTGVFPNRYYLSDARRAKNPLGLTAKSPVVKIMRSYGWEWGDSYRDYHHFQL